MTTSESVLVDQWLIEITYKSIAIANLQGLGWLKGNWTTPNTNWKHEYSGNNLEASCQPTSSICDSIIMWIWYLSESYNLMINPSSSLQESTLLIIWNSSITLENIFNQWYTENETKERGCFWILLDWLSWWLEFLVGWNWPKVLFLNRSISYSVPSDPNNIYFLYYLWWVMV